jgi:hypothetical protein
MTILSAVLREFGCQKNPHKGCRYIIGLDLAHTVRQICYFLPFFAFGLGGLFPFVIFFVFKSLN